MTSQKQHVCSARDKDDSNIVNSNSELVVSCPASTSFRCGSCCTEFLKICALHDHLQNHVEGGSYIYDHYTRVAYPRFKLVCAFTQFDCCDLEKDVYDPESQNLAAKEFSSVSFTSNNIRRLSHDEGHISKKRKLTAKVINSNDSDNASEITYEEMIMDNSRTNVPDEFKDTENSEESTGNVTDSSTIYAEDNKDLNVFKGEKFRNSENFDTDPDGQQSCDMGSWKAVCAKTFLDKEKIREKPVVLLKSIKLDFKPEEIKLRKTVAMKQYGHNREPALDGSAVKEVIFTVKDLEEFAGGTINEDEIDAFVEAVAMQHTQMNLNKDSEDKHNKLKISAHEKKYSALEEDGESPKKDLVLDSVSVLDLTITDELDDCLSAISMSRQEIPTEPINKSKKSTEQSSPEKESRVPLFVALPRKKVTRRGKYYTYECPICRQVGTHSMVTYHKYLHKENKELSCDKCGRLFQNPICLKVHMKTHGEKEFRCSECGAEFHRKKNLNVHLLKHSGERPHMCELCGKAYREASELRRHKKHSHEQVRNHVCEICGDKFFRPEHLRNHKKRHFGPELKCQYCGRGFKLKCDLVRHTTIHTGEKSCYCKVCNEGFRYTTPYYRHMKRKHDIEKETAKEMRLQMAEEQTKGAQM